MPTINEYIERLENVETRANVTEIDFSNTVEEFSEKQQSTLISLLIKFSYYRPQPAAENQLSSTEFHQVKLLKLKKFSLTYAEIIEIINSGITCFELKTCNISLEENLQYQASFGKNTIYVPPLQKMIKLEKLVLNECTKLTTSYLIYLRMHIKSVEIANEVTPILPTMVASASAAVTSKHAEKKILVDSRTPDKQLLRQKKQYNLKKSFVRSPTSSLTASTSTPRTESTSSDFSPRETSKSFSWECSSILVEEDKFEGTAKNTAAIFHL